MSVAHIIEKVNHGAVGAEKAKLTGKRERACVVAEREGSLENGAGCNG
jgi:hypothetical protein